MCHVYPAEAGQFLQDLVWSVPAWAREASVYALTGLPTTWDLICMHDFHLLDYFEELVLGKPRYNYLLI